MSTSHDDYVDNLFSDPWRDPDPIKQKAELEFSFRARKYSVRWETASSAERQQILLELRELELQIDKEFGLTPNPAQPQTSLANKIRIK